MDSNRYLSSGIGGACLGAATGYGNVAAIVGGLFGILVAYWTSKR